MRPDGPGFVCGWIISFILNSMPPPVNTKTDSLGVSVRLRESERVMACEHESRVVGDGALRHVGNVGRIVLNDAPSMPGFGRCVANDARAAIPVEVARAAGDETNDGTNGV